MKKILSLGLLVLVVAGFGAGCRSTPPPEVPPVSPPPQPPPVAPDPGSSQRSLLDLPVGQFLGN